MPAASRSRMRLLETHKEPRVLSMLSRIAQRTTTPMFHWSIADGIVRNGMDLASYNTNELLDALKHVDKAPQAGLCVFCDAHPGLSNPVNVRLIREIALEHHEIGRTLVFVSPKLEGLPSEMLRLAAHFRPRLPPREDIRAIVDQEAQRYPSQSGRLDFGALHNTYHGETERSLRQAIAVAEDMAPCVLWMDEIEKGLASSGGGESDGGVGRRVLGSLLTWMSERTKPVFVVATANDISQLPPERVRTRPLSTVMAERIDALRDGASTRSVMADVPEPESSETPAQAAT
jgi:hypothetical protein